MNNEQPQAKAEAPVDTNEPVFHDNSNKSTPTGLIIGMVLLALIAIGGVGFGVWEMVSQGQKVKDLETQVANCASANNDKAEDVTVTCPDGTVIDVDKKVSEYKNPVIESTDSEAYSIGFQSSAIQGSEVDSVNISVKDGRITSCTLMDKEYFENGGSRAVSLGDCNITGLTGEIYKVVEFGAGQVNVDNSIGFIMTDGTVKYFPLYDAVTSNDFSIKGSVNIEGYVVDVIDINVMDLERGYGGYVSSMFVLSDGSYKKYDTSMLE